MSFIGACLGGVAARLVYHPFDTGRVNLQLTHTSGKGSISIINKIISKNGLLYLYNGLGLSSISSILGTGVYISSYNTLYNHAPSKNNVASMASALIAECLASIIFVPAAIATERIQIKRKIKEYRAKNSFEILANIIRSKKINILFKGYWSTLIVFVPLSIIQMPVYENVKNKLIKYGKGEFISNLIGAFTSAGIAWWITSPLDMIRFRIQVQNAETQFKYKGLLDGITSVYNDRGIRGLFRGSINRGIIGSITFSTIIITTHLYDTLIQKIHNTKNEFKCRLSIDLYKIFYDRKDRLPRLIKNSHYVIASIIAVSSGIVLISPPSLFHNALLRHQIKLSCLSLAYLSASPLAFDIIDSKTYRFPLIRLFVSLKTVLSSVVCLILADYSVLNCMLLLSLSSFSYSTSCRFLARKSLMPKIFAMYQSRLSLFISIALFMGYIKAYYVAKDLKKTLNET